MSTQQAKPQTSSGVSAEKSAHEEQALHRYYRSRGVGQCLVSSYRIGQSQKMRAREGSHIADLIPVQLWSC